MSLKPGRNSVPIKALLRQLLSKDRAPEAIARGAGLGACIAFWPLIGMQFIAAIVLAPLFRANRIAAVLATLLSNPVTAVPQAALAIWMGSHFSVQGPLEFSELSEKDARDLFHLSGELLQNYLIGTFLLSIIGGLTAYLIVRLFLHFMPASFGQKHRPEQNSH